MRNLILQNASAGAGKTTALTQSFADLCFSQKEDPFFFRRILALTFTNKAAAQLKDRLFRHLHKLTTDDTPQFAITNPRQEAPLLLQRMLFHYEALAIHTIDSFYHQAVESLLKEMRFSHISHITLHTERALDEVISRFMDEPCGQEDEDAVVFDWLMAFVFEKLREEGSWKIAPDLKIIGSELFKEPYREAYAEADSMASIRAIKRLWWVLDREKKKQKGVLVDCATQALRRIEGFGLDVLQDFRGKKFSLAADFLKLKNGKGVPRRPVVSKSYSNLFDWMTKNTKKEEEITHCVTGEVGLMAIYERCRCTLSRYYTASFMGERLRQFGLMSALAQQLRHYRTERRTLFVSDFSDLLKRIHPQKLPTYLYERLGTTYAHYFIDECQDTSLLQWQVIQPLIQEGLSRGKKSILIGDEKQSIYSFRGAEPARLFGEVRQVFSAHLCTKSLSNNYRSGTSIVDFNGQLFKRLAGLFGENFSALYKTVAQRAFRKEEGKVMVAGRRLSGIKEKDSTCYALSWLREQLKQLHAAGYAWGDITILVRNTKDMRTIIDKLAKEFTFFSTDALYFSSSSALRLLMYACKYLYFEDPYLCFCMQHEAWLRYRASHGDDALPSDYTHVFFTAMRCEDSVFCEGYFRRFYEQKASLQRLGLCDVVSRLMTLLSLDTPTHAVDDRLFLYAFQHETLTYVRQHGNHLGGFIDWWEQEGKSKALSLASGGEDAIRLLTIHKAKGLEFKVVLLPFCNWEMSKSGGVVWCDSQQLPLVSGGVGKVIGKIPISYKKNLPHTALSTFYAARRQRDFLENLNVLYVAFTRAQEVLGVFCNYTDKSPEYIGSALHKALSQMENFEEHGDTFFYEKGAYPVVKPSEGRQEDRLTTTPYAALEVEEFLAKQCPHSTEKQEKGKIFHNLLSHIHRQEDSAIRCHAFCVERHLSAQVEDEFQKKLRRLFSIEEVSEWFSSAYEVRTEMTIFAAGSQVFRRPDRVLTRDDTALVVDFKTGKKRQEDEEQVRNYMRLLTEMDYKVVQGRLLYVEDLVINSVA